jgi:hypothetical protein
LPPPTVGLSVSASPLKPRDSIGRMSVDYPRSVSDYDHQLKPVSRGLAWAGFLASFAGDTLGRKPLR